MLSVHVIHELTEWKRLGQPAGRAGDGEVRGGGGGFRGGGWPRAACGLATQSSGHHATNWLRFYANGFILMELRCPLAEITLHSVQLIQPPRALAASAGWRSRARSAGGALSTPRIIRRTMLWLD
jgi:hypothetical protein